MAALKPPTATSCAWCATPLGMVRDKTPGGVMHPDCATSYRRRFPTVDRPTTLPPHLR